MALPELQVAEGDVEPRRVAASWGQRREGALIELDEPSPVPGVSKGTDLFPVLFVLTLRGRELRRGLRDGAAGVEQTERDDQHARMARHR